MTGTVAPFSTSRVLAAPRALVFAVHTQPEHLARWMSPAGFKTIQAHMDFKVGGSYHYGIEGPNGMQMWGLQVFREIVPNEKIVYLQSFSDADRGLTRHPMSASWPLQMLATSTFADAVLPTTPTATEATISWHPHDADAVSIATFDAARSGMTQGFAGTFAKLEAYLAELQQTR